MSDLDQAPLLSQKAASFEPSQTGFQTAGVLAADDLDEEKKKRRRLLLLLLALLFLLVCLLGLFIKYLRQPAPLPELVAPQADINYPPHYLFSIYGVDRPVGVALSPSADRIYVAESAGERLIKVFDREGNPLGAFMPPGTKPGERSPVYLATDSQGYVYVSDRSQHAIMMYDADGNYMDSVLTPDLSLSEYVGRHVGGLQIGTTYSFNIFRENVTYRERGGTDEALPAPVTAGFWSPLGVFIDETDTLYVTDVAEARNNVREFRLPGTPHLLSWNDLNQSVPMFGATGAGIGEMLFPNAAVADSRGRVFVSDGNNGRVSVWDDQGSYLFTFGKGGDDGNLSLPRGMFIDEKDKLFVVDAVGQDVKVYDVADDKPEFLYSFGGLGMDDGLFNYPNDIELDDSGRLYIVDRENHRIQIWSY